MTNRDYRQLNQVSNKPAYLELDELMEKGLLKRQGTGKAVEYILVTG